MSKYGVIALNRFGLGGRPGDLQAASGDPRAWVNQQIRPNMPLPAVYSDAVSLQEARTIFRTTRMEAKEAKANNTKMEGPNELREMVKKEFTSRMLAAVTSSQPFYERMVLFWANHFTVSGSKGQVLPLIGPFERDAIRPHVFGRFADMLKAASLHPAMLVYLDNAQSLGPNSQASVQLERRRERNPERVKRGKGGLNENLAREIMELHTLGVNAGYSQQDVTNFAKVLTGWSLAPANAPDDEAGRTFFPARHEPGAQTILGRSFAEGGESQAYAVLDFFATHPATARHIATKLARHFISDTPPEAAITKIANAFLQSGGDLAVTSRAVLALDEPWQTTFAKFKRPDEYVISILRAMNDTNIQPNLATILVTMGMQLWRAPSPQGWPDTASEWAGEDALWKRIEYANLYATRFAANKDARQLMAALFGDAVSGKTQFVINGAESPVQGITLLLTSPEFMRR